MTANSQLLKQPLKRKQKQTKQITRTGTEPQKEITWRVINRGVGGGEGGKLQRISSINDRWKIVRGRVRIV